MSYLKKQIEANDDEDNYEESFDSFHGSPMKKTIPPMNNDLQENAIYEDHNEENDDDYDFDLDDENENKQQEENEEGEEEEEEEEEEKKEVFTEDLDLETFMNRYDTRLEEQGEEKQIFASSGQEDPSMRPLEGTSPNHSDSLQANLSKRMGHDTPQSNLRSNSANNTKSGTKLPVSNNTLKSSPIQLQDSSPPLYNKHATFQATSKSDQYDSDDNSDEEKNNNIESSFKQMLEEGKKNKDKKEQTLDMIKKKYANLSIIEKENSNRVDALLSSLNLMPKSKTKLKDEKKLKKINNNSNYNTPRDNNTPRSGDIDEKRQISLESQIALLKKELKGRDDRLLRQTEQLGTLSNHCDNLKGETSQLNRTIRELQGELEAKEKRLHNALKAKKKALKNAPKENDQELELAYGRLQERESALLEAVEELSNQNQDLIQKLKQSMARELEQSYQKASNVVNKSKSIYEENLNYHQHKPTGNDFRAKTDSSVQRIIKNNNLKVNRNSNREDIGVKMAASVYGDDIIDQGNIKRAMSLAISNASKNQGKYLPDVHR